MLVGVNRYKETEPSPLTADAEGGILVVDPAVEAGGVDALDAWRAQRDAAASRAALDELRASRRPTRTSWRRRSPPPARA